MPLMFFFMKKNIKLPRYLYHFMKKYYNNLPLYLAKSTKYLYNFGMKR